MCIVLCASLRDLCVQNNFLLTLNSSDHCSNLTLICVHKLQIHVPTLTEEMTPDVCQALEKGFTFQNLKDVGTHVMSSFMTN